MQLRHRAQFVVESQREIELMVEGAAEGRNTMKMKRQPEPQPAIRTRQLGTESAEIRQAHATALGLTDIREIGAVATGVPLAQHLLIPDQKTPGAKWHEQTLMGIQDDAVSGFDPG